MLLTKKQSKKSPENKTKNYSSKTSLSYLLPLKCGPLPNRVSTVQLAKFISVNVNTIRTELYCLSEILNIIIIIINLFGPVGGVHYQALVNL